MNRARAWLPLVALLALLGFAAEVAEVAGFSDGLAVRVASAEVADRVRMQRAEPYREGPLDLRSPATSLEWPAGASEFLALAVLSAILYGFRASGLARQGGGKRTPRATGNEEPPRASA